MNQIQFLLVPDKSSARLVKRKVAEKGSKFSVIVGTWPELAEQARKAYLLPETKEQWDSKLAEAARSMTTAFWAKSREFAEVETLRSINSSLTMLLEGAGTTGRLITDSKKVLSDRALKHLKDLISLHNAMGNILPEDLAVIKDLLKPESAPILRSIIVYHNEGMPRLNPWQKALIQKIQTDSKSKKDAELEKILAEALTRCPGKKKTALTALQSRLFQDGGEKAALDNSLQWLAVRDHLEEAEVAAGMVQVMLGKDSSLTTSDIGLLIPSDTRYTSAVQDAFTLAGLPLSGLNMDRSGRDFGREALLHFILCCKRPSPAMALAALLTNPLMPWTKEEGNELAGKVMGGRFDLSKYGLLGLNRSSSDMLNIIRRVVQNSIDSPSALGAAVGEFLTFLSKEKEYGAHIERACLAAKDVRNFLKTVKNMDKSWKDVRSHTSPEGIPLEVTSDLTREGIAVCYESEEPWRSVKHLWVLGFKSKRYPAVPQKSAVFGEDDLIILKNKLGYDILTHADVTSRSRDVFKRQLSSATESITVLIPKRDDLGNDLQPADTLAFMQQLFKEIEKPEHLITDLETEAGREAAKGISLAPSARAGFNKDIEKKDIDLGTDLLTIRTDSKGDPTSESPTSLETLMISPFAWFLGNEGLLPSDWAADDLDVKDKGILAHEVFKGLFPSGEGLPSEKDIRKKIPGLMDTVIKTLKPLLVAPEWEVERNNLRKQIEDAAVAWCGILTRLGAEIIDSEIKLKGTLDSVPLTGRADQIIALKGGTELYVVDFKKSKVKSRRERMESGFESQATLYRLMIKTGGPVKEEKQHLTEKFERAKDIGVMYYLMDDQIALKDITPRIGRSDPEIIEIDDDISHCAMEKIGQRLNEVSKGTVCLNTEADEEWYDKNVGMNVSYTLEASPLVSFFMKPKPKSTEADEEDGE